MSTPTPRTDGNTMHPVTNTGIIKTTAGVLDADGAFVFAVLARQLERELAEALSSAASWSQLHDRAEERADANEAIAQELRTELAAVTQERDMWRDRVKDIEDTLADERRSNEMMSKTAIGLCECLAAIGCTQEMFDDPPSMLEWCTAQKARAEKAEARVRELEAMLVAQQPDIDALVKNEGRLFKANADLRAQLARMSEALRPFAELAKEWEGEDDNEGLSVVRACYKVDLLLKHIRAAAALATEVGK